MKKIVMICVFFAAEVGLAGTLRFQPKAPGGVDATYTKVGSDGECITTPIAVSRNSLPKNESAFRRVLVAREFFRYAHAAVPLLGALPYVVLDQLSLLPQSGDVEFIRIGILLAGLLVTKQVMDEVPGLRSLRYWLNEVRSSAEVATAYYQAQNNGKAQSIEISDDLAQHLE